MKKRTKELNCPYFRRDGIELFNRGGVSLYGNIATGGVIKIISRKAISPLGLLLSPHSGMPVWEDSSGCIRRKNLRFLPSTEFCQSSYPSIKEKATYSHRNIISQRIPRNISKENALSPVLSDNRCRRVSL